MISSLFFPIIYLQPCSGFVWWSFIFTHLHLSPGINAQHEAVMGSICFDYPCLVLLFFSFALFASILKASVMFGVMQRTQYWRHWSLRSHAIYTNPLILCLLVCMELHAHSHPYLPIHSILHVHPSYSSLAAHAYHISKLIQTHFPCPLHSFLSFSRGHA